MISGSLECIGYQKMSKRREGEEVLNVGSGFKAVW